MSTDQKISWSLFARISRLKALEASYKDQAPAATKSDSYIQPQRYVTASRVSTFCLITSTSKANFEIADLPPVGQVADDEVALLVVRPDSYVGAAKLWLSSEQSAVETSTWLDDYFGGFLIC
ncbi:hypothetical protein E4T47_08676 [Aureobasidium subglaciale]|nr:hypothetical protein E4T47_08676 [Aureobasidium subglaciale]